MQTFLPVSDFIKSAQALDNKRLNKQKLETKQLLACLLCNRKAWSHHPAALLWKGHTKALAEYGLTMCVEWRNRGGKDNVKMERFFRQVIKNSHRTSSSNVIPDWIDERLYSSHRAALLKKNYEHYCQFNWKEKPEINYFWPKKIDKK